jgi:hypothetical protein
MEDRMKTIYSIGWLVGCLLWASLGLADVVVTTPYPYSRVPAPGAEKGTFAFNGSAAAGSDCYVATTGAVKFLPNSQGTGGTLCAKANTQWIGAGPLCASAIAAGQDKMLFVAGGPYFYNHDGTLCENLKIVGGVFDGLTLTFHDYVSPKGDQILVTGEDIDYPCPGLTNPPGPLTAGPIMDFRISDVADDPPGSGRLDCTNP